jgi:hypothetical protein
MRLLRALRGWANLCCRRGPLAQRRCVALDGAQSSIHWGPETFVCMQRFVYALANIPLRLFRSWGLIDATHSIASDS